MKAAVIGGAGYAGGELLRLLLSHPEVEVTQVTSERLGGKFVHTVHPHLRRRTELKFQSRTSLQPVDVLFIALPHGETSKEIDQLQTLAPTIIDLSADFRLRDRGGYPTWYGWEHPQPAQLNDFVYALPELHREQIRSANRLAAGGCLATAAIPHCNRCFSHRTGSRSTSRPTARRSWTCAGRRPTATWRGLPSRCPPFRRCTRASWKVPPRTDGLPATSTFAATSSASSTAAGRKRSTGPSASRS